VAKKYLQYFPTPVLEDFVKGRWLPVIGAGMSLNAILPPPAKMPLWAELGKKFADEVQDYSPSSVLDGISAYEHEYDRARLIERLIEFLHLDTARPGPAHREFCTLPFDIVCTTNFDFLLEKAYDIERQDKRTVHPVVDEDQLSINVGTSGTLLLKLHGDTRHPKRLVVTEADYDAFLTNYPLLATFLANLLITKTAVFIGYSLDDPDFRQIWQVVTTRLGKTRRTAYAILVGAKQGDIARYERRGVKVVNLSGTRATYGTVLAEAFAELREYRREHAGPTLKPTEEKPLEQFLLPRDAMTRLCLFATPLDVLPFYRERIFPLAEEAGFVPVTAADVVDLADSVSAKIDTLIDRAAVVVVDAASTATQIELGLALARLKSETKRHLFEVIVVISDLSQLPSPWPAEWINRSSALYDDSGFVERIGERLLAAGEGMGLAQRHEPQRLFSANEFRAAVISAMALLETTLRRRLEILTRDRVRRPMSTRQLLDYAQELQLIDDPVALLEWNKIRNDAVHAGRTVTRAEAKMIVEGVERIVNRG
jgi:hypothetical protein